MLTSLYMTNKMQRATVRRAMDNQYQDIRHVTHKYVAMDIFFQIVEEVVSPIKRQLLNEDE